MAVHVMCGPAGMPKISAARGEKVTMSVAASQLQSPSRAATSARFRRSASESVATGRACCGASWRGRTHATAPSSVP